MAVGESSPPSLVLTDTFCTSKHLTKQLQRSVSVRILSEIFLILGLNVFHSEHVIQLSGGFALRGGLGFLLLNFSRVGSY